MRGNARAVGAAVLLALITVGVVWLARRHSDRSSAVPTSERAAMPDVQIDGPKPTPSPIQSSVDMGLDWLSMRQSEDGHWNDAATTGMALLSFLGAGETHRSGSKRETVKRGLDALIAGQDARGCLVSTTCDRPLRDHAIAALALTEAYCLTGSHELKEAAERAVAFAQAFRGPGAAWNRERPGESELDLEAAAWMSLLLKSADVGELAVDRDAFPKMLATLDRITDPETGSVLPPRHPAMPLSVEAATAIGFTMRVFLDSAPSEQPKPTAVDWLAARPLAARAADWLLAHRPAPDIADAPFVYFGSIGMLAIGGEPFRAWLPALTEFVSRPGVTEGPNQGSWDPTGDATKTSRIRETALHLLCCEFYYGPVGHASMRK